MTTFDHLEKQKSQTLALLADWSPARLAYRPTADAWSAIQVIDHIVRAESAMVAAARRGLQKPHRIGVRDRLGYLFVYSLFRSARRVKVPGSVAQVLPDANVDFASVRLRWNDAREDLARLLSQVTPDQLRAGVFRHPVIGWMSVPRILGFFAVHIHHHAFQLARIRAASEGI